MKKIITILFLFTFILSTNQSYAQRVTSNEENNLRAEGDSSYVVQEQNNTDTGQNGNIQENNENQNTEESTSQEQLVQNNQENQNIRGVTGRIKQQAKAIRTRIISQISRKSTLSETRSAKLQNPEETARLLEETRIKKEELIREERKNQGKSEVATIGEAYRNMFNKLQALQVKIENSLPKIESSKKVDMETLRENINKSRESLKNAEDRISELEKIDVGTGLDENIQSSKVAAKKDLLESKKYLNSVLVSLKQALKAKTITQTRTGGGVDASGATGNQNNNGEKDGASDQR